MKTANRTDSDDPARMKRRNQAMLDELCNRVCDRIEGFMEHLGVDLKKERSRMVGPCPVHGGDNRGAVSVWTDGRTARGNWQCRTRHCHDHFSRSLLGFTHGVLSHARRGWTGPDDEKESGRLAVGEMCRFLGIRFDDIEYDEAADVRRKFAGTVETLSPVMQENRVVCSRESFLKWHRVPAPYYLGRGFRESTLRKFDVGECLAPRSPNLGRTIIPVHDASGEGLIGIMSRSPHPKCPSCRGCHEPSRGCSPDDDRPLMDSRWVVGPRGFNDKHHLYNLWRARPLIRKSKCVVLVEGAGDVWRLDEAGVYNAVALMGSVMGDLQDVLLEECSPAHVVLMTDDDDAGNAAADAIARKWGRLSHVHRVKPIGASEVADMSAEDVRANFKGLIEGWMRR